MCVVCVCNFLFSPNVCTNLHSSEGLFFFFFFRIREVGKRGTRSKGRPGLSDVFASPILPITYLSFSSTSFFAGVCSAGKETGEQSSIRKKNRGQRKGVCEKVSFVAGGETDLQAAGQDTGEKH